MTMRRKLLVLCGPMAAGKSSVCRCLCQQHGYSKVVTYTTRTPRPDEHDGVDYRFVSEAEFAQLDEAGVFLETTVYNASFGTVRYGTSWGSIYHEGKRVAILDPDGVRALREKSISMFTVLLDPPQEVCMKRALQREDSPVEIARRVTTDTRKFQEFKYREAPDLIIDDPALSVAEIAEMIVAAMSQGAEVVKNICG